MDTNAENEFNQDGVVFLKQTNTRAGVNAGLIVREIKTVINDQASIISEGRSLMAAFEACPKNQQIGTIICWLNKELQDSSERLDELIAHFQSA